MFGACCSGAVCHGLSRWCVGDLGEECYTEYNPSNYNGTWSYMFECFTGGGCQGGGSIQGDAGTQFNRNIFGLSFGLKNQLSFGLRFSTLRKCSNMCSLDMSKNQNGISIPFSSQNSSQDIFYWIAPQWTANAASTSRPRGARSYTSSSTTRKGLRRPGPATRRTTAVRTAPSLPRATQRRDTAVSEKHATPSNRRPQTRVVNFYR